MKSGIGKVFPVQAHEVTQFLRGRASAVLFSLENALQYNDSSSIRIYSVFYEPLYVYIYVYMYTYGASEANLLLS